MLSWLQAITLGLVQGVTEFLPISSSAHLILLPLLAGWPDQGLLFDTAANSGTLAAVMVYFRHELAGFARSLRARLVDPRRPLDAEEALWWMLVAGTVPVAVAGALSYELVATQARNPLLIAATLIGFGVLLWLADRFGGGKRKLESRTLRDLLIMGLFQAISLIPGTSRSGITLTAGLGLQFDREAAARLSFLLAVPVGGLVAAKDVLELSRGGVPPRDWDALFLVFAVSGAVGYLVIGWLLAWFRRQGLTVFVVYRLLLGLLILVLARGW